ncbi:hypothetical protein Tco_1466974 [Tanacetum coccineum]
MDDPNITMEEYIRLEEEKARKHGKVFNWETAKYGKIWYDEDVHDLRSVETEFPAIVFNDNLTSNKTLSCEPTVSSLNDNEIDFRISFDESNDEDYTIVFDKKSFYYKIIFANDLKTDSKNDNEKVNMPLFPSPEPSVSCIDDLNFFKDFENEFPAIVYNDALTSKSDFSTEPTLCPQHIDEFDLKDETSLSEYDKVDQNVLYFNDLFPFNLIYTDDLKSDKDNDDSEINMIQSSRGNENTQGSNNLLEASHDKINKVFIMKSFIMKLNVNVVAWNYLVNGMLFNLIKNLYVLFGISFDPKRYYKEDMAPLPTRDQRHLWLRNQVEGYNEEIVHDFEQRLETIFGRIGDEMGLEADDTLCFQLGGVRRSMTWRQFILALGLHTAEEMAEDGLFERRSLIYLHQRSGSEAVPQVKIDNPNITMEEYIMLEEEKSRRRWYKVVYWKLRRYGKIWDNEDVHDLGSVKNEFPAIVFTDMLTSKATLSCEPTVGSFNNNEIGFRISFDESDDEDCTVIFDKNSFSYKIISVNNLKTDSKNDNDKVKMPLISSPEPTVGYFDVLDYFKDFEKEFPAIVYNDAQTSKLDFLTEPTISPQHIDEFNLKDETSLSECDEEEQNVICFIDLFPFNVIYPDDSKSEKDNDDDKIDIKYTVYTAYSLNEYSVFDIGPREGKSMNVGGEFTNLEILKIHKDGDGDASFQLKSDSLPHAHAQTTKTFYKHQDSRIMKAQELKTKTSAQTLIYKIFLQRYQVYQGRLLASFQDDAKYEHVGQDTRSQGGKDDQDGRIKI